MDSTLIKLIILSKVVLCLLRCLNLKNRQTEWSVSSETTGDLINTKNVKKQELLELLLYSEINWGSIASKSSKMWLTLVIW